MKKFATLLFGVKNRVLKIYEKINEKCFEQFKFTIRDVTFEKIIDYLNTPKDSSSLAVTRILFGVSMLFDIPDERGGAAMTSRWGDPNICHFPLIPFMTAILMPYMALIYLALWFGALGITLGYRYSLSSWLFTFCYWYLFLIEKSFWNNHSYLFGLVALLLSCTQANCYWSVDTYLNPSLKKTSVPYWHYFILKYQFFILYFMAGLKKGTAEWLTGYSVQNLSEHWVFSPFELFLTVPQIDYLIVHWFIFIFDLTIAFWMMWAKTRNCAMVFCALFHMMNSRIFSIGMFPWVCLATMPLFYPFDWPKRLAHDCAKWYSKQIGQKKYKIYMRTYKDDRVNNDVRSEKHGNTSLKNNETVSANDLNDLNNGQLPHDSNQEKNVKYMKIAPKYCNRREKRNILLILLFVISQAFLPYSHFITKGYNNWTDGLYGYSWDMMVHTWDVNSVIVKVVDNDKHTEYFVDPYIFTPNDRWTRHGDMIYQYAHCLKDTLLQKRKNSKISLSDNISVYIDVWCSLNGRFTQRMFDSKVNLLNVSWSPFMAVSYLMPLLDEGLSWRNKLQDIKAEVYSQNNQSDVIFIADISGYEHEKFIPKELVNVSLKVLKGTVLYETKLIKASEEFQLDEGTQIEVISDTFHKVTNIGQTPAFYMYTFINISESKNMPKLQSILPLKDELSRRFKDMIMFAEHIISSIFQMAHLQ